MMSSTTGDGSLRFTLCFLLLSGQTTEQLTEKDLKKTSEQPLNQWLVKGLLLGKGCIGFI